MNHRLPHAPTAPSAPSFAPPATQGTPRTSPLIDPLALADALHRTHQPRTRRIHVLDVRWRLDLPEGRPAYLQGHIPGAVYVDLEQELARRAEPSDGRHPIPPHRDLQQAVRRWGINDGDFVVAYDDISGVAAARLWWLLRRTGIRAHILDGGLAAWKQAGLPLAVGDVQPEPGTVTLKPATHRDLLDHQEIEAFTATGVLLDVRSPEQYSGARVTIDPIGGHIPGAVNLPALAHVNSDGRFYPPRIVRHTFEAVGVRPGIPVGIYCGSGIASAHTLLALHLIGLTGRIYSGAWSQWVNTRGHTVATGILPRGGMYMI